MSERQTKAGNQITLSLSFTVTLVLTLTLIQSLIQSLLTCWTTFVFISMLKTHPHTFSLSLSLAISLSLFLTLTLTLFQSLIQSLSTCWTSFVFTSYLLKTYCLLLKITMFFFGTSAARGAYFLLFANIYLGIVCWISLAGVEFVWKALGFFMKNKEKNQKN